MSARILVVDDIEANVRLLEAKLSDDTLSLDDKALIIYALALVGQGDLVAAQNLAEKSNEMLSGSVAYLAMALKELGDEERGRAIAASLLSRLKYEDDLAYLDDQAENYQHNQTSVMQTSTVLWALSEFAVEDEAIAKMANWLNQARRTFDWYQVYDNSQALRGLLAYAVQYEDMGESYNFTVDLNGEEIARGKVEKGKVVEGEDDLRIGIDQILDGENTLFLTRNGRESMHLVGDLVFWSEETPDSSRVNLQRTYRNLDRGEQTSYALGVEALIDLV